MRILCPLVEIAGANLDYGSVTSTYMFPYKEDLVRFDFKVDEEDEYMCAFPVLG